MAALARPGMRDERACRQSSISDGKSDVNMCVPSIEFDELESPCHM